MVSFRKLNEAQETLQISHDDHLPSWERAHTRGWAELVARAVGSGRNEDRPQGFLEINVTEVGPKSSKRTSICLDGEEARALQHLLNNIFID